MKQLTIFHFFDFKQDQFFITLQNLKVNQPKRFEFGEINKNSLGLYEFRNAQEEKAFSKVIDCYLYFVEEVL